MYISGTGNSKAVQRLASESDPIVTTQDSSQSDSFNALLEGILAPLGKQEVSEEELFASVIHERIHSSKGAEAATEYADALSTGRQARSTAPRFSMEELARESLSSLVESGTISQQEAETINAQAFKASQLDNNLGALYDHIGGDNDPTIAVANLEEAISSAQEMVTKLNSGDINPGTLNLGIGNTGRPNIILEVLENGSYKLPGSESNSITPPDSEGDEPAIVQPPKSKIFEAISSLDNRLTLMLPSQLKSKIEEVILRDMNGNILESGEVLGEDEHGRPKYAFSQPGADYPKHLTVEVQLSGGMKKIYSVPDASV